MTRILCLLIATSLLSGCITADNKYPHRTEYDKYIPKDHQLPRDTLSKGGVHDDLIPQKAYKNPKTMTKKEREYDSFIPPIVSIIK